MNKVLEPIYLRRERELPQFKLKVSKTRNWEKCGVKGLCFKTEEGGKYFAYFPFKLVGNLPITIHDVDQNIEIPELKLKGTISSKYFIGQINGEDIFLKYL